jgi:beta-lactamase regulating signal transducer with metallopeptidase domain/protocatechuate 3,4-dioxygenase beta subunit
MTAEAFLTGLARISAQSGVLVLLVLLAQWLFRKQLSPTWRCALWFVVIARLVLPFSPRSAVSIFNLVPHWQSHPPALDVHTATAPAAESGFVAAKIPAAVSAMESRAVTENQSSADPAIAEPSPPVLAPATRAPAPPVPSAKPIKTSWPTTVFWFWLAGVLALSGYCAVCSWRLARKCRGLPALTDASLLAMRDDCARRLGRRAPLPLVESATVASPALFGLFRPRLMLPAGFVSRFTEQEVRFVFLHEMAHLKRRDLLLHWLVTLLQIAHWPNPLLWLGFACWRSDREVACDALALEAAGGNQNREYGHTILRLLEGFTHRAPSPGLVGILEDRRQLRRRIGMISRFRPGQRWGVRAVALMGLLALLGLTDAQTPKAVKPGKPTNRPSEVREERVGTDPTPDALVPEGEGRTLIVTVLDGQGHPLPGAEVHVPYVGDFRHPRPKRLTDAHGKFTVLFPLPPEKSRRTASNFSVSADHPDFARRSVMWTSSGGDVYAGMPGAVTIKLEKGLTVGGMVKDERGRPVKDVRVLLSGSEYRGFTLGNTEREAHEYAELGKSDPKAPAATTDAGGRWSFAHFPAELEKVELTLVRADDARESFSTQANDGLNQRPTISLDELKAQTLMTSLHAGVTVRGVVVDENGRPLRDVTIQEGYGHGNIVRVSEFSSDRQGRFERHHRAERQWIYTASAAGRATASVVAQIESTMPEVRIVLPPAKPWRVRITDEAGKPLPDAELTLDTYRNEGQILDWAGRADLDGRIVWTNASTTNVTFYATSKALGASRKIQYVAGESERQITLGQRAMEKVTIRVKTIDSVTREPVNVQTAVARFEGGGSPYKTLASPDTSDFTLEIQRADFRVGMYPSYELKLDASGYETILMESIDFDSGDQVLELALHRLDGINQVTVLQPDGQPAAEARLWTRSSSQDGVLFINAPGRYYGDRLMKAQADERGRIQLPGAPAEAPVVIAHADGFLETTMAALRHQREVRLTRYGVVEGRLMVAGKPKKNETVSLNTLSWSPSLAFHLGYTAATDADGRFTFKQVPPGQFKLYRWGLPKRRDTSGITITETYQMPVTVLAGQTNSVEYASAGRAVIGQAVPASPDTAVDWLNDVHTLTLKLPPAAATGRPNREDYASLAAFLKANNAASESEGQKRNARAARVYALEFEADGSFRIDDVPPGTYELRLSVTKGDESQHRSPFHKPNELGALVRDVVVPEGREPFDLGRLTVAVKESAPAKTGPSVNFQATTLDHKPLTLAQFRGTNVLLVFWAAWSERSQEQLATLPKLRAQYASNSRLVFVTVNVDETDDEAQKLKAPVGVSIPCWLDQEGRQKLIGAFDINTLPAIYLVDTEGHLVARDLEGDRLSTTLRRTLAKR